MDENSATDDDENTHSSENDRNRKIIVTNIPENVDEETIEMFFESKRKSGGGSVENIEYDRTHHSAVIEFEDVDTADSVISFAEDSPIKLTGTAITIQAFTCHEPRLEDDNNDDMEKPTKIFVTNLPSKVEKENLELYFENKRKTGGGPVANLEYYPDKRTAVIEFEDPETVDSVLSFVQNSNISLLGTVVEVQIYTGFTESEDDKQDTIVIHNLPEDIDDGLLESFFQSKKRPYSGFVDSVDIDYDKACAIVKFENPETVDRIFEHLPIVMMGVTLDIQRPDKVQPDFPNKDELSNEPTTRVMIQSLPMGTTTEQLEMFFENPRHGGDISNIQFVEGGSKAVIEFEDEQTVTDLIGKGPIMFRKATIDIKPIHTVFNTIEVRGPAKVVDEENMQLYFENERRSGGRDIEKIVVEEGETTSLAYVTFRSEDVAKSVVNRSNHSFSKQKLAVALHDPYKLDTTTSDVEDEEMEESEASDVSFTTVQVTGIKSFQSPEPLNYYFENKRKSGGGKILDFSINDDDEDVALVKFESTEGTEGTVKSLTRGSREDLENCCPRPTAEGNSSQGLPCYRGTMVWLFPNINIQRFHCTTTSNGRQIMCALFRGSRYREGNLLTFANSLNPDQTPRNATSDLDSNFAKAVANRHHTVNGEELKVTMYIPPEALPCYPDKLLVKGVGQNTTEDCFLNFLEAKSGVVPLSIMHGEDIGTKLVTFESKPDVDKLQRQCKTAPLEGNYLTISTVPISNCIKVSNTDETVQHDTVELYFENKNRSGGGDIEKVEIHHGYCFVRFRNYRDIEEVLKREHTICNVKVTVALHHECLGNIQGVGYIPAFVKPDDVIIPHIDPLQLKFLTKSNTEKMSLEQSLKENNASLIWPEDCSAIHDITIKCYLTADQENSQALSKSWTDTVKGIFASFMDTISVHKEVIPRNIWSKAVESLATISVDDPSQVIVSKKNDTNEIVIVGVKKAAQTLSNTLKENVKRIEKELEIARTTKSERIKIDKLKSQTFQKLNLQITLEKTHPGLQVSFDKTSHEIIITGQEENIRKAEQMIYKETGAFISKTFPILEYQRVLLESDTVKQHVESKWHKKKLIAAWKLHHNKVDICSAKDSIVQECADILSKCLIEHEMKIDDSAVSVIQSDKWNKLVSSLKMQHRGKVHITFDLHAGKQKICIRSTDDIGSEMIAAVGQFLARNTIMEEELEIQPVVVKFLNMHCKNDISNIQSSHSDDFVKFEIDNASRMSVSGNTDGINKAMQCLYQLADRVKKRRLKLSKPGLALHLQSADGQDTLSHIERNIRCTIITETGRKQETAEMTKIHITEQYQTEDGRTIKICIGDLTGLKVDALACAADKKLKLTAGLARCILTKGGVDIKTQCRAYLQRKNQLEEGDAIVIQPGGLQCKRVIFVNGPEWNRHTRKVFEKMMGSVQNVLQHAAQEKAFSVALPALFCGKGGFPVEDGTKSIVEALKKYFSSYPKSHVREVYLADVNQTTVTCFSAAVQEVFLRAVCMKVQAKSQNMAPKAKPKPTIHITVMKGELAKQEVDVILNTTSNNGDLTQGAVSSSILKAAGPEIQTEIYKEYPKGIQTGQLAYTQGYKLKCQMVMHAALVPWETPDSLETMQEIMTECLAESHRHGYTSVAFPALGTGSLGYPKDIVAKTMFETVESFSEKMSGNQIRDVQFVIYELDKDTVKSFEVEQKRRNLSSGVEDTDDEEDYEIICEHGVYNIGSMVLKVKSGDLMKEKCDCIVNSTNVQLDMSRGAVAQALMTQAGSSLKTELSSKRSEMRKNRIILTDGYNLSCDKILHVEVQHEVQQWREMLVKCLTYADSNHVASIAFPAIGSGLGMKTKDMATVVFSAIMEFESGEHETLREVRFVMFDKQMFSEFCNIVDSAIEDKSKGIFGHFWSGLKGLFGKKQISGDSAPFQTRRKTEDTVNLTIYAMSDRDLDEISDQLSSDFEGIMYSKTMEKSIIKRMGESELKYIDILARQHHVDLKMMKDEGRLEINGIRTNVYEALDKIYDILRDVERNEHSQRLASYAADVIQWHFVELDSTGLQRLRKYEPTTNSEIEDAYKAKESRMELIFQNDDNPRLYVIDFLVMTQYPHDSPEDKVPILRRDIQMEIGCTAPDHWSPMTDSFMVLELSNTDHEFTRVSEGFMESSGGGYIVTKIQRIQNLPLWQQYQAKKTQLDSQNPPGTRNERMLWHGTKVGAIDSINQHGYNRSYCGANATAFGNGVYFAEKAVTACNSTYAVPDPNGIKHVYQCRVLTGEYTQGQKEFRTPPAKPSGGPQAMYDSLVDDTNAPSIYVIFNDTQAYPEYLISFKRVV